MRRKIYLLLILIYLCCLNALWVNAEELPLTKAITVALRNNLDWQITQFGSEKTFLQKNKALANLFPSLSVSSGYSRSDRDEPNSLMDADRFPLPTESFSNSVNLSQNVFNLKTYLSIRQAEQAIGQTKYLEEKTRHEIILAVKTAYYNIQALQAKLDFYQETFARDGEQLKYSQKLLQAGKVIKTEVLRAEITLEKTRQNLSITQNDLESAKMTLNELLNVDLTSDYQYETTENLTTGIKTILATDFSLADYSQKALTNNYQLKIKDFDRRLALTNVNLARADYLPTLSGSASYSTSEQDKLEFHNRAWRVGLNLNWNVFDAGLTKTAVRQAELEKSRVNLEQRKLEQEILLQIRKILNELENLKTALRINQKNLELATENYHLVQGQYQNGLVSNLNLIDAEVIYNESKINLLDAFYAYKIKLAQWEDVVGDEL